MKVPFDLISRSSSLERDLDAVCQEGEIVSLRSSVQ